MSKESVAGDSARGGDEGVTASGHFFRDEAANLLKPESIGPYRILSLLGEGGFGVVYLAEQTAPVRRRVAVKVVKPGMDSKAVLARFEQERQALAVMDHPCIAKVFDAGTTERSLPYFVMELVRGMPITTHCDQHRLGLEERVRLFIRVCEAVQHAHMKGVVHRDLKPSNVLVSYVDGSSLPKIIDFGVAKALNAPLTEATIFTQHGQLIGTPEYMSPEQAEMGAQDIDTRSDVYSLGVLLYELLTGVTPFDRETLRAAGYAEIQRIIREVEPPKPSTRLEAMTDETGSTKEAANVARARRMELRTLSGTLRRDLDWVVMKCLEKDRARRYDTANALAMELARYLNNEPVLAGPPSTAYRVNKFMKRNRSAVIAGGITVAVLLGATGVSLGFGVVAVRERDRANSLAAERDDALKREILQREMAEVAEFQASARAEELALVAEFQSTQLSSIDAVEMGTQIRDSLIDSVQQGDRDDFGAALEQVNVTNIALGVLDNHIFERSLEAIDIQFATQPHIQAALLQTVADALKELGLLGRALAVQKRSVEIRLSKLGSENPETIESIAKMGALLVLQGRYVEAEACLRDIVTVSRSVLGDSHPTTILCVRSLRSLLLAQDRPAEAIAVYDVGREASRALEGEFVAFSDLRGLLNIDPGLRTMLETGGSARGDSPLNDLIAIPAAAVVLPSNSTKLSSDWTSRYQERVETLGENHRDTIRALAELGFVLLATGKHDEAEQRLREAMSRRRRTLGDDHPDTVKSIMLLGYALLSRGKLVDAQKYLIEAVERAASTLGESHYDTIISLNNLGVLRYAQDKPEVSLRYFCTALATAPAELDEEHSLAIVLYINCATVLCSQGNWIEAEQRLRSAAAAVKKRGAGRERVAVRIEVMLSEVLAARGLYSEVIERLGPLEVDASKALAGFDGRELARFLSILGRARIELAYEDARFSLAEQNLSEAFAIYRRIHGESHQTTFECVQGLVDLYTAWHAAEPDKGYDLKAAEWRAKLDGAAPEAASDGE